MTHSPASCFSRASQRFTSLSLSIFLLLVFTATVAQSAPTRRATLRQADAPTEVFSPASIFPPSRASPILVHLPISQQLSTWDDTALFFGIVSFLRAFNPLKFPQNFAASSLIIAPTNKAFLQFLESIYPDLDLDLDLDLDPTSLEVISFVNTLLSNPQILPNLLQALSTVVDYHLVQPLPNPLEPSLPPFVTTYWQNTTLDFTAYPDIRDSQNNVAHRLARQFLHPLSSQTLILIDAVLLPLPLPLIQSLFPPLPPTLPSTPPTPPTNSTPTEDRVAKSPYFFKPFTSKLAFVNARSDLNILNALLQVDYQSIQTLFTISSQNIHVLFPTDDAFISLIGGIIEKEANALEKLLINAPNGIPDVASIARIFDRVSEILMSVPSLPSISQILQYHVLMGGASLAQRVDKGPQDTAFTDKDGKPFQLVVKQSDDEDDRFLIQDLDPSRDDAKVFASFATLDGYASVIDSLLTSFDVSVATTVIGAADDDNDDKDEDEDDDKMDSSPEPFTASNTTAACFPGSASVHTHRGLVRMRDLKPGDEVWTYPHATSSKSRIYLFTHRDENPALLHTFVQITTKKHHKLTLTPDHYVYTASGTLITAASMREGMHVISLKGVDEVVNVRRVRLNRGLFAPHSLHGDLVVDGIWTSSYSKAVAPMWAHALLAPVRFVAEALQVEEPLGSLFYRGCDALVGRVLPMGRDQY